MLKTILDYILNEERLHQFFIHLLWISPLTGMFSGILIGWIRRHAFKKTFCIGMIAGLLGSFISMMWFIYNAIMNYYGLDSVKGLLINLLLFTVTGAIIGLLLRRRQK